MARLIIPVCSDTTMTAASVFSLMPTAARWRVPSPRITPLASASGRMHAAAMIRSSRITTAPSCRGVFGSNMFSSSGAEISAFSVVPVSITSWSPVFRSKTISAPTLRRLRSTTVWIISSMMISVSSSSLRWLPRRSAAQPAAASSGWSGPGYCSG